MIEVKVIIIKAIPADLKHPVMCSAIPTTERARAWGERMGFKEVYYYRRMERVYGERVPKDRVVSEITK